MPEGDTLRRLADHIDDRFAGSVVERSVLRDPRLAGRELAGRRLVSADAYGKHLFVRFDDGRTLHAHLRMDGKFAVGRPSTAPAWKRRVELWFPDGSLVGEGVPLLELIDTDAEADVTAPLGPDLCAPSGPPGPDDLADRLRLVPETGLTPAMLDQHRVAGWGNVYVNDVPFICGLSPFQPVGSIDELRVLTAVGTALIRTNARLGPQNTTGRRLQTDARWVHGSGRRPCPVCGDRLRHESEQRSPWHRSITWCETCQPTVDPTTGRARADIDRVHHLIGLHPAMKEPYLPPA